MTQHRTKASTADDGRRRLNSWRQHRPLNYFSCDPYFQGIVARHLGIVISFSRSTPDYQTEGGGEGVGA